MKIRIVQLILPILLLLLTSAAYVGAASSSPEHGDTHGAPAHKEAAHDAHAEDAHGTAAHGEAGAHGEAHGDGHGDGHGHGNSLSAEKLKDLFWRIVNFIALVIILVKFLGKPVVSGLSGRQKQIESELQELHAQRDDAQEEYKEFEARLAGMEEEMERVVEKAIAQAESEKKRILQEAEDAADDIKRQAEAAVQAEIEDAKRILRVEVAEQAAAMAEELIVKNLTPEDQVTITEQYLERVGAKQ